MKQANLAIITNGNYFSYLIIKGMIDHYPEAIKGILIVTGDYKGRKGIKSLWELSKTTTWPYLVYKAYSLMILKVAELVFPRAVFSVKKMANDRQIPYSEFPSVKTAEAISWIQTLFPDLIVSVSCPQMIGKKILSLPKLGGINIHSSLLPKFAGLAPYYWVLSMGEKDTGITVHYMTMKFDEGNILVQKRVHIEEGESTFHLFKRLAMVGCEAIQEAIKLALEGSAGTKQDLSSYTYFSNPSFHSYLALLRQGHRLIGMGELIATIRDNAKST